MTTTIETLEMDLKAKRETCDTLQKRGKLALLALYRQDVRDLEKKIFAIRAEGMGLDE